MTPGGTHGGPRWPADHTDARRTMNTPTRPLLPVIQPDTADRRGGCACGADSGLERVTRLAATPSCPAGLAPGRTRISQGSASSSSVTSTDGRQSAPSGQDSWRGSVSSRPGATRWRRRRLGRGGPRLAGVLPGQLPPDDGRGEDETVGRLQRLHELRTGKKIEVSATGARPGVLFGYAFNISKCHGYMDCVRGLHQREQSRPAHRHPVHPHPRDREGESISTRPTRRLLPRGARRRALLHRHAVLPVRRTRRA